MLIGICHRLKEALKACEAGGIFREDAAAVNIAEVFDHRIGGGDRFDRTGMLPVVAEVIGEGVFLRAALDELAQLGGIRCIDFVADGVLFRSLDAVDHFVLLKTDEDGAVMARTAASPVIDPQNAWGAMFA